MAGLGTLLEAEEARRKLWAIPGVLRIGFGLKETAGEVVPRYALRVYVADKRPADAVAPHELIPPEVDGILTDVAALHVRQPECSSPLKPGMQITREVPNAQAGSGSIGCFVQKNGQSYILTNQHVIVPENNPSISTNVYHPKRTTVSGIDCNKPIALVVGEDPPIAIKERRTFVSDVFWLDCGLMQLNAGVGFVNDVVDIGMIQPAIRDLFAEAKQPGPDPQSQQPATPVTVQKRGAMTDVTAGTIVELCAEERPGGPVLWELAVRPTTGATYSETFQIAADEPRSLDQIIALYSGQPIHASRADPGNPASRRLRFQGSRFSAPGDSGSVWLDASRRIVGLHNEGSGFSIKVEGRGDTLIPTGRGGACHIRHVFGELGLDPSTGVVVGAHPTAGAAMLVPGGDVTLPTARLAAMERRVERSARGRALAAAVRSYDAEVRALVHHRRRVTLVWHRRKGPAFVAAAMNAAREGSWTIPTEVAGHRLVDLLRALEAVLRQEGSVGLRAAVERHACVLIELAENCETLEDALLRLEREPEGAAA